MSKFFISCDEATAICDKNQYGEARFFDKIKLTVHMYRCKICKCYSGQNVVMTKMYKKHSEETCNKNKCLSNEDKQQIEERVKEKIS